MLNRRVVSRAFLIINKNKMMKKLKKFFKLKKMEKNKTNRNPRKIDVAVKRTTQGLGSQFAVLSKMEISAWKAYLAVFFVAGFFAALILGIQYSWYMKSRAAAPTIYTLTENEVHKAGETFTTQVLLDSGSQNVVAVQVVATFDPASVSVLGFDTTATDFPFEVMKNIDTAGSKIFVALAKQAPGVNSNQGKIGVVSLQALKDFNGAGIALTPTATNISDGSAAILDDGKGTNILAAVSSTFTNPAPPVDSTPPVRTGGSPTGTLAVGTSQANLKVTTNESAICKYDPTAGTSFGSMSGSFSSADGLSHSANVTGLSDGKSYSYYVRCSDAVNNTNNDDYKISFSVASAVEPPVSSGPVISSVTASTTATSASVSWQTDVKAH